MRVKLLASAVMLLLTTACAHVRAADVQPRSPVTLQEFLGSGTSDLVVVGTVVSATEETFKYRSEEVCGYRGLSLRKVTKVAVRVDRVIYGVADTTTDSLVNVVLLKQGYGQITGQTVFIWAEHEACDAWQLNGYLGFIVADGSVVDENGGPIYSNPDVVTSKAAQVHVEQMGASNAEHPSQLYNDAIGIALVRVNSVDGWNRDGAVYHVTPLAWVAGSGTEMPTEIAFPLVPGCSPGIFRTDSMLVPMRAMDHGSRRTLKLCPTSLRVKHGFVPGLGVYLPDLDRALQAVGQTRFLRPYQQLKGR